jgi:carbon monoxide dehydrogenase subunit G
MKFEKEISVAVKPDRVWAFLWDVDRVARCLPGCKEAKTIVPHERYEAVVSERMGPFKVQFPLEIEVLEGQGTGSRLVIHSEVGILGKLAALGDGIIQHKADGLMTQFAESLRKELEAGG